MSGTTSTKDCVTTGWVLLAENVTGCIVQMGGQGYVRVAVAADDPGAESEIGIVIDGKMLTTLPLTGLESGVDEVWGRAIGQVETVTVLTSGAA
jgi:hypothetical protein